MNKYKRINKKPYHIKCWTCFIGFIIALIIACSTLALNISESNRIIFQLFSFLIADFTILLNFCYIESQYVFDYAKANKVISDFSKLRLSQSIKFNNMLKMNYTVLFLLSLVIIGFAEKVNIEYIKLICLTLQIIYILPFVIYKTYFLKLITAFSENDFLTDMSVISFDEIDRIKHIKTYDFDEIKLEEFEIISNQIIVGKDKLSSHDYNYLKKITDKHD